MKRNYLPLAVLALVLCAVFIGVGEAITANEDFVSTLVREFYNKTSDWESTLKRYALIVFRWLVTLEVCFLGSKAALNRDQIPDIFKQFVMLLLMAGFFLAVINYYQEWAWSLINGLGAIGRELTPGGYSSESPFLTGMQLVKLVQDKQLHRAAHRGAGHHRLFRAHFRSGGLHQVRSDGCHGGGADPSRLRRQFLSQGLRGQRHPLCAGRGFQTLCHATRPRHRHRLYRRLFHVHGGASGHLRGHRRVGRSGWPWSNPCRTYARASSTVRTFPAARRSPLPPPLLAALPSARLSPGATPSRM